MEKSLEEIYGVDGKFKVGGGKNRLSREGVVLVCGRRG